MSYSQKTYNQIVQDIFARVLLNHEKILFKSEQLRYNFGKSWSTLNVIEVKGIRAGIEHTFQDNLDYTVNNGALEWSLSGQIPDDNTEFDISYVDGHGNGKITDVSTGSVLSVIVGAISKEIELLYKEMTQVYNSGFADLAHGTSLDRVVAILGVTRNKPAPATGYVTFWRNSFPQEIVYRDTFFFQRDKHYELKNPPIKTIKSITGLVENREYVFKENTHYTLDGDSIKWIQGNELPDEGKEFTVQYIGYKKVIVPVGTTVSTSSMYGARILSFQTAEKATLIMNSDGKFSAEVKVKCMVPGSIGNVPSNSLTQMPKPPEGVEAVNNTRPTEGGLDEQSDQSLREEAKLKIYTRGNATLEALMVALKDVHGVKSSPEPVIIDPYDAPGIVKILLEGEFVDSEVSAAIEKTRAAGIKVEFARPRKVSLDIGVDLTVNKTLNEEEKSVDEKVIADKLWNILNEYLSSLPIGTNIIDSQLKAEIMLCIRKVSYVQYVDRITITAIRAEGNLPNRDIDKKRDKLDKKLENSSVQVIEETAKQVDIRREEKAVIGSVKVAIKSKMMENNT